MFTAVGLLPGGSGYFTCIQNMKLVTTKFKSGGLHEKHLVMMMMMMIAMKTELMPISSVLRYRFLEFAAKPVDISS